MLAFSAAAGDLPCKYPLQYLTFLAGAASTSLSSSSFVPCLPSFRSPVALLPIRIL